MVNDQQEKFMLMAIELGRKTAFDDKAGGPFGCVIVKDGKVIGQGANRVLAENDPTCHGEITAIRAACHALGTHELQGCILFSSAEPCPMCYGAAWWARIKKIYYAGTIGDAKEYGNFDDVHLYQAMKSPGQDRMLPCIELLRKEMLPIWKEFDQLNDRPQY